VGGVDGLSNVYLRDLDTGRLHLISAAVPGQSTNGPSYSPTVDAHGQRVAFISIATNLTGLPGLSSESVFLRYL
jgi:hypothetical protein